MSGAPANSGRADKISKTDRTNAAIGFCDRIKELGLIPGVYAGQYWLSDNLDYNKVKVYSIWCPKYGTDNGTAQEKPNIAQYDGWQFTSKYKLSAISSAVDMSYFYKDFSKTSASTETKKEETKKEETVTYKTYYANDKTGVNYRATPNGALKGTYAYAAAIKCVVGSDTKAGNYTWLKTDKGYWVAKDLLSTSKPSTSPFKTGQNYTLTVDVKVRTGAGTQYAQKTYSQLTADGKKNAYNQASAVLKKGTVVTVTSIKEISSKEYWGQIPSGWIALMYNGEKYVK